MNGLRVTVLARIGIASKVIVGLAHWWSPGQKSKVNFRRWSYLGIDGPGGDRNDNDPRHSP